MCLEWNPETCHASNTGNNRMRLLQVASTLSGPTEFREACPTWESLQSESKFDVIQLSTEE
jgi:hypothetical protein